MLRQSFVLLVLGLSSCLAFIPTSACIGTTTTTTRSLLVPSKQKTNSHLHFKNLHSKTQLEMMSLRGGASLVNAMTSTLSQGPLGVVSLWTVASAVVVPLTLVRQGFSFSVGYGFSVMTMALSLSYAFYNGALVPPTSSTLLWSLLFYGFRLGTFLTLRNTTVASKRQKLQEFDKTPRLKRIPLAVSVSLFYALLSSPVMYALRFVSTNNIGTKLGMYLAWTGALLEAWADGQKYVAKMGLDKSKDFCGPTGGVYQLCRHPNYLGEVVFWMGIATSGVSSLWGQDVKTMILPVVYAGLGLYGIVSIMTSATKRLDQQQLEKYKGHSTYDDWRAKVKAPLVPFVHKE